MGSKLESHLQKESDVTQVAQTLSLSLSPGCPETQPLPKKSLLKTTWKKQRVMDTAAL